MYKNPGSPDGGSRANRDYLGAGNSRGKKYGEYFGNGFASLFEDEVILCGDGKLAEGTYQFNFELEFPDRDLPSSIDVCSKLPSTGTWLTEPVRTGNDYIHGHSNTNPTDHYLTYNILRPQGLLC